MINFSQKLFDTFEGQPIFDRSFAIIDPDQDGNYTVFGSCGDLVRSLLNNKVEDQVLLIQLTKFIDNVLTSKDPEWENVIKSEVISILNNDELIKLRPLLSEKAHPFVDFYLR